MRGESRGDNAPAVMTIVTRLKIEPGKEPGWDEAFRRRVEAARDQPGWVAVQLCIPAEAPNERVVIGTWESRADWEAWHATDVFRDTRMLMEGVELEEREEWWHEVVLDERR
jgi:heme-degrading monooxygenase HmoA